MNKGKLQAKQEKLKSLHCSSPQSSLFSSRGPSLSSKLSSTSSEFSSLISYSPAPNPDHSAKSPSFSSKHNSKCSTPSPKDIKRSATRCTQQSSESVTRCLQHLFVDVSTGLLRQGQSVRFCAPGQSMHPTIKGGETITVVPVAVSDIRRGDILLYKLGKKVVAHRVVSIKRGKNNFATKSTAHSSTLNPQHLFILRGDASLTCDEPVGTHQILGKVASVEKRGRSLDLYSQRARIFRFAYDLTSRLKRLILHILKVNQELGLTFGGLQ